MADNDRTLEKALAEVLNRGEVYLGQRDLAERLAKTAREWFDVTIRVEPRIVTPPPIRSGLATFQDVSLLRGTSFEVSCRGQRALTVHSGMGESAAYHIGIRVGPESEHLYCVHNPGFAALAERVTVETS